MKGVLGGQSGCEASEWVSDTSIRVRGGHGVGGSSRAQVTAGQRVGSSSAALSYGTPSASVAQSSNVPASGSLSFTLLGSQHGFANFCGRMRIGFCSAESTLWTSESSLVVAGISGVYSSRFVSLTAGFAKGSLTDILSFNSIMLSTFFRTNLPGSGSAVLTLLGVNFGFLQTSPIVRLEKSQSEYTKWHSYSSVQCTSAQGHRKTLRSILSIGIHPGSISTSFSFQVVSLSAFLHFNYAVTGAFSITVLGSNLGITVFSNSGRQTVTASEATVWLADSALACRAGASSRSSNRLLVTLGESDGSFSDSISLDIGLLSVWLKSNSATTGTLSMTLFGSNFGITSFSQQLSAYSGAQSGLWVSETSITCRIVAAMNSCNRLMLTVSSLVSTASEAFTYVKTSISTTQLSNVATAMSRFSLVFGSMFGLYDTTLQSRIGLSTLLTTLWISESTVHCVAGNGLRRSSRLRISANNANVGTTSQIFTFDEPKLLLYWAFNFATSGASTFTVTGLGFGAESDSQTVTIGFTQSVSTSWISDSTCNCKIAHGNLGSRMIALSAGEVTGSVSDSLTFSTAYSSSMRVYNLGATGAMTLTVQGSGLGVTAVSGSGRIGQSACESSLWTSDSAILCSVASMTFSSTRVVVSLGQRQSSRSELLSHDNADVSSLMFQNFASKVKYILTVHGANIASGRDITSTGSLLQTLSESSHWISDTALLFKVPIGSYPSRRITITSGLQVSSISSAVTYCAFAFSRLQSSNYASSGSVLLTIFGRHLGFYPFSCISARVVQTQSELTSWISDTAANAIASSGVSGSKSLILTAGVQLGSTSAVVSYLAGSASCARSINTASSGAMSMTLFGAMYGMNSFSNFASPGRTCAESSSWLSDTSLKSFVSGIATGSQRISYSVGSQEGTLTQALSIVSGLCAVGIANIATSGSARLTLLGSHLGLNLASPYLRSAQSDCERSIWISETSLGCLLASSSGSTHRLTISLGELAGSISELFSTDSVELTQLLRRNFAATGSISMTMLGSQFGLKDLTITASHKPSACEATVWTSDTALGCTSARSSISSRFMSISVAHEKGSISKIWSIDRSLSHIVQVNCASTGLLSLTLMGSNFGSLDSTSAARSLTSCESTGWLSDTAVQSGFSMGYVSSLRISISCGIFTATHSGGLSFAALDIETLKGSNSQVRSTTISIFGSGYSVLNNSPKGVQGGTTCESTIWHSVSSVVCMTSEGSSRSRFIIFTSGSKRPSTTSALVSYNVPSMWNAALARSVTE